MGGRIAQEADYHVEVEGRSTALPAAADVWAQHVERSSQVLVILGGLLSLIPVWTALVVFVWIWSRVLVLKLCELCVKHWPRAAVERKWSVGDDD